MFSRRNESEKSTMFEILEMIFLYLFEKCISTAADLSSLVSFLCFSFLLNIWLNLQLVLRDYAQNHLN